MTNLIESAQVRPATYWLIDAFSVRTVLHEDPCIALARQAIALTGTVDTTGLAPGSFPPVTDDVTVQDMATVAATYHRHHGVDPAQLISHALACLGGVPVEDLGI